MTFVGWVEIGVFSLLLLALVKPLGIYMQRVFDGESTWLDPLFKPIESVCYRVMGVDSKLDMHWTTYAGCMLALSLLSLLFTYAILRLQGMIPFFNPMGFSTSQAPSYATAMTPDLAFNTAVSFTTNTNWQAYSGESTLSYLAQMLGLAFHNWLSAPAGIAAGI